MDALILRVRGAAPVTTPPDAIRVPIPADLRDREYADPKMIRRSTRPSPSSSPRLARLVRKVTREFVQTMPTTVLAAAARGEVDLNTVARYELAGRGLDRSGASGSGSPPPRSSRRTRTRRRRGQVNGDEKPRPTGRRPTESVQRVNVDFPVGLLQQIDRKAKPDRHIPATGVHQAPDRRRDRGRGAGGRVMKTIAQIRASGMHARRQHRLPMGDFPPRRMDLHARADRWNANIEREHAS